MYPGFHEKESWVNMKSNRILPVFHPYPSKIQSSYTPHVFLFFPCKNVICPSPLKKAAVAIVRLRIAHYNLCQFSSKVPLFPVLRINPAPAHEYPQYRYHFCFSSLPDITAYLQYVENPSSCFRSPELHTKFRSIIFCRSAAAFAYTSSALAPA